MFKPLPIAIQTTYQDLLERHRNRPDVSIAGSLLKKKKAGHSYWIARRRLGEKTIDTQIGPDRDDIRSLVEVAREEQKQHEEWRQGAGLLVSQLRAVGSQTLDMKSGKVIASFARAGFFHAGGILGGTHAFALYELELGVRFRTSMARTEDIDLMADRNVSLIAPPFEGLLSQLDDLGLVPIGGMQDQTPTKWQTKDGIPIDILTPRKRGGSDVVPLEGLGLHAQALPFLEFSIASPLDAVALYREGIMVKIPTPERYAVHKLIVAEARSGSYRAKSGKDLMQAEAIITVLAEQRPFELKTALNEAVGRGPKWKKMIEKSLKRAPKTAELIKELN